VVIVPREQVQAGASASFARTALVTEGAQAGMLHVDAGCAATVEACDGEQRIGGSGGSLDPPRPPLEPLGPLPMHLHTVHMEYSGRLPTRLDPLAERACFPQACELARLSLGTMGCAQEVCMAGAGTPILISSVDPFSRQCRTL
jgi:hypothetical protein